MQVRPRSDLVLALAVPAVPPQKTPHLSRLPIVPPLLLLFLSLATGLLLNASRDFVRGIWDIGQGDVLRAMHQGDLSIVIAGTTCFVKLLWAWTFREGRRRAFRGYAL